MGISESEKEWLRIRWEFLRRDPAYRKAWVQWEDFRSGALRIEEGTTVESHMAAANLVKAIAVGYEEFGLSMWLDPRHKFEDMGKTDCFGNILLHCLVSRKTRSVLIDLPNPDSELSSTTLSIDIDLARVNSKTALKEWICTLIDQQLSNPDIELKRSKRKVDYERILTVGLLKEKGMSNRDIAKELFPDEFQEPLEMSDSNENIPEPNPESAERKVSHYLSKYKELIGGGHIDMTYP
jgi:hypothetical protein